MLILQLFQRLNALISMTSCNIFVEIILYCLPKILKTILSPALKLTIKNTLTNLSLSNWKCICHMSLETYFRYWPDNGMLKSNQIIQKVSWIIFFFYNICSSKTHFQNNRNENAALKRYLEILRNVSTATVKAKEMKDYISKTAVEWKW